QGGVWSRGGEECLQQGKGLFSRDQLPGEEHDSSSWSKAQFSSQLPCGILVGRIGRIEMLVIDGMRREMQAIRRDAEGFEVSAVGRTDVRDHCKLAVQRSQGEAFEQGRAGLAQQV